MSESESYDLRLSLNNINTVLKALGRLPFEDVYAIIHEIHRQVAEQNPGDVQAKEGQDLSQ